MERIEMPRNAKGFAVLKIRPPTTHDVVNTQVPLRRGQNIRRGHIVRGARDIARIGRKPWERVLAGTLRRQDRLSLRRANRFYYAMKRV